MHRMPWLRKLARSFIEALRIRAERAKRAISEMLDSPLIGAQPTYSNAKWSR